MADLPALRPATLLSRVDGLSATIESNGGITIVLPDGGTVGAGRRGLQILDVFAAPIALEAGVAAITARGAQDWMDTMATVRRLVGAGVLVRPDDDRPRVSSRGYGSPKVHIRMLDDRTRTAAYIEAIEKVVRPGDVVVDIGTGTGVLAATAAKAGASRVYAVEMNPRIADVADAVFVANGVGDQVTIVRGASTDIELPERADVLVSEMIGNDIFDERMLPIYTDAKRRLLKPGARLIPSAMTVLAIPYEIPAEQRDRVMTDTGHYERWREWYDLDFGPLGTWAPNPRRPIISRPPKSVRNWRQLGDPAVVSRVEMQSDDSPAIDEHVVVTALAAGRLDGVCLAFDATLADGVNLTNAPPTAGDDCHWPAPVWPVPTPFNVAEGDAVRLRIAMTGSRFRVEVEK